MSNTPPSQPAAAGGEDSPMQAALTQHKGYYAFLVLFLVLMSSLGSFVNDMYTPALPVMCRFFGCSVPLGQMGLTMGMAGLVVGQIVLGSVSDRYGRRGVAAGRPGNILHSTAIVFVVLALTVLWLSRRSKALAPDLQK